MNYETLTYQLAMKAKELTQGMLARVGRLPDAADYNAAFQKVIEDYKAPNLLTPDW